jgi:hypothetical protein
MWGNNQLRNGTPRQYEVYVTGKPLEHLEKAPADSLAAYGEWKVWDPRGNSLHANETFNITFSSVRGRYIQFRFVATYFDHWSGYPDVATKIAAAADIKVFTSEAPYEIDRSGLEELIVKSDALRGAYLPKYGYANSMLNNWVDKAKNFVTPGNRASREMVDEIRGYLADYVATAKDRFNPKQYDRITPKIMWADDRGNHLQAHGAGLLWDPESGKWWVYGEDRTNNGGGQPGVHAYSSEDLYNWKDENLALPVFNNTAYNELGWEANPWYDLVWNINQWRKAQGDWNCDGVIDPLDPTEKPTALEQAEIDAGRFPAVNEAWAAVEPYIPPGNPPLYIGAGTEAQPYPSSLGLTASRINEFNALYANVPVWRRKQIYRFYNFQTTIERPKVVYNATSTPYTENGKAYRYVMFVHIEGGFFRSNYGTAKVLIAVADNAAGPFKILWAYHTHFTPNYTYTTSHMGMTRDQNVLVDADGQAWHFGSTQENRIMGINKLDPTYTWIVGVPRFHAGESQAQLLQEGFDNQMGVNFNWVYGDQREAPAPFIHYETSGMTMDGDGSNGLLAPNNANKRYYCITSTSTGWFTNPQGIYRTSRPGDSILGRNPHPTPTGTNSYTTGTADGSAASNSVNEGSGWITVQGNSENALLYGVTNDGTTSLLGFDGQTTNVTQLRYPQYVWGLVGYEDDGYKTYLETNPQPGYAELEANSWAYVKPVYDYRYDQPEPRAGKLVYGKYIYMADSWDQHKNYDARYIWLPMRALAGTNNNNDNGSRGVRVRWMNQWRWEDFVYDIGPFKDSLTPNPAGDDIWNVTSQAVLTAYDAMLNGYKD